MRKLTLFLLTQTIFVNVFAQSNGTIIEKTELKHVDDLIAYVKATESHDSIYFDLSRFEYFEKVQVFGITYWSDSLKVKGFLLQPYDPGPYPAIIYNRGGSLDHGSLTHHVASIGLGELARIAYEGYVIAASQYRGNGGGEGKEQYGGDDINDVLNLIPLLNAQPKADIERLGMFGWSRGGMTSFLTLKRTDKIKALVVGGPSTNLLRSIVDRPELDEWWSNFIPNYNVSKEEILKKRSAVYWVHELPKNVPMLIVQGGSDKALLADYTLAFARELTKYKIPHRLIKYEDGSHSLKEHQEEVFEQLFAWFDKYLEKETSAAANISKDH